ncbi:NADH:ubiquinone reductase (Na(+)-transporting) subunit C [Candidatus Protochlamydia phocaeensis]|uniref:NADH:ubiquinone reductase (Na(+)-transporting) subunit C n=1 Tax=Candidatus Protochlamydia phocaeensis TaxID=1414722 RepID=UPI000AC08EBD|nr:NADH:ubiquinone reductase (Na(+)-transporting) subunit C [Candidatus Protochlamydia phocaeensis]
MQEPKRAFRISQNQYTLLFMVILSLICALILSVLASALQKPQEMAKELDRSKQMLIAARIISPYGYFLIQDKQGQFVPAKFTKGGVLEPSEEKIIPSGDQILDVYRTRISSFLVNDSGEPTTFQQAGIDEQKYVSDFRKTGYYREPLKLIYKIYPNPQAGKKEEKEKAIEGYVIPINGMGLWDAIYGYLAIKPDGNTVIGISWYDQKETPGLGANIAEPDWQSQFPGKHIFQESGGGKTDFKTASLGITVVKGKVNEVLGNSPKALSAVDGMAGATLTGNGVTNAYKDVLAAYRPFLIRAHDELENSQTKR